MASAMSPCAEPGTERFTEHDEKDRASAGGFGKNDKAKSLVSAEWILGRLADCLGKEVSPGRRFVAFTAVFGLLALPACGGQENEAERERAIESMRSRPLTYVAIGASDTVGVGASNPVSESWVAILSSRLPPDTKFVRLGVSGSTAEEAVNVQLPAARRADPDLVTIWLAGNDFAMHVPLDEYERSLATIIQGVKRESPPRIFIANLPDLTNVPAYLMQPRQPLISRIEEWNQTIARVAEENGAILVDLYATSETLGGSSLGLVSEDGFHPSTQGYRVIADAFWESITKDPILSEVLRPRSEASLSD